MFISFSSTRAIVFVWVVVSLALLFALFVFLFSAPIVFDTSVIVEVSSTENANDISIKLDNLDVIRYASVLKVLLVLSGKDSHLIAGDYLFDTPESVFNVAKRLVEGKYGDSYLRITLFEGETREQMADKLGKKFLRFNKDEFMRLTRDEEGYLFPDTYKFFPSSDTKSIIKKLRGAMTNVIEDFNEEITNSGHSLKEVITMASIIEKEAYGRGDSFVISGILWKRIKKGMFLQVDAPFVFAIGRGSAKLRKSDLSNEDNMYNTYTHKGLPPGPIGNPGRLAIEAALNPEASSYYFYLHDKNGGVHYSKDFSGHKRNKRAYID